MSNDEIKIYKQALSAISRICNTKKRQDSMGDILCECNRAKRLVAEMPENTDWKKQYSDAQYRLDFIMSLCESQAGFGALPESTKKLANEVLKICKEPITI